MSGSHEIELKFLCAPEDLGTILAAAPPGADETRELRSVYFDTADLALQKQGVSLRVRESKGRRVQTLKRGEGLAREEHEHPVDGDAPDPRLGPLPEILPEGGAGGLRPAFDVRVTRRQRLVRHGGATIELAVDEGEVNADGAAAPISEVELELKSGRPKALFALARELSRAAPLYLSFDSKAARGQALAVGAPLQARRKERVELPAGTTAAQAFRATARNALGQIAANAVVMRDTAQPDATHQLRVAARRLRSAISTFSPLLSEDESVHVKAELRWLAHACDAARNLDVLAERVAEARTKRPSEGLAELARAVEAARQTATAAAVNAVRSERFRTLMIDATAWIETGAWLADDAGRDVRDQKATAFAAAALDRRRRKLRKLARRLDEVSDQARHAARIEAKKLRYAAETFASLFPEKATARFVGRLKDLQEELGALNDVATAEPVLAGLDLTPAASKAARDLLGRQSRDKAAHIRRAVRAFEALEEAPRFWR